MKGIAHFASGVAAATFFPWTLAAAQEGNPLYFILGGAFGILPDTLDFKFYRFFYKHDIYIEPVPNETTPQDIADRIAAGVALAMDREKMVRIKLSTIRLGADYWQQYTVKFDAEKQQVMVKFGPVVNTGQVPVPGTEPEKGAVGRAALPCPLHITYDASSNVDIFDGPTFGFKKDNQNGMTFHFLPWHREWSHALTMGVFFSLLLLPFLGWRAALVIVAAYSAHVLEDQLGFMGSNLFFPFTKSRAQGVHIMRSGDSLPNFTTVWLSCLLMFWNMYRFQAAPLHAIGFFQIIFWGGILPVGFFWLVMKWLTRNSKTAGHETIDTSEWEESVSV